jgi:hypothetical protein
MVVQDVFPIEVDDVQLEGPIQPGLGFYKWLIKTPAALNVNIPIPETIVTNDSGVYYLHNVGSTLHPVAASAEGKGASQPNKLVIEHIPFEETLHRDDFVLGRIEEYVANSVPVCHDPEPLENRIVAVLKKPNSFVSSKPTATSASPKHHHHQETTPASDDTRLHNSAEVLLPQSFQASLLNALDRRIGSFAVIQKYVRSKGLKPSIHRVEWKATGSLEGEVRATLVTRDDGEFVPYTPPSVNSFSNKPDDLPMKQAQTVQFADTKGESITNDTGNEVDISAQQSTVYPGKSVSRAVTAAAASQTLFAKTQITRHKPVSAKQLKRDQ